MKKIHCILVGYFNMTIKFKYSGYSKLIITHE